MANSDAAKARVRSRVRLPSGRVVVVTAGSEIPPGGVVIEGSSTRSTVSRREARSADVAAPSSGARPSRKRKPKA